ncbi:MAG TPA: hypothetical protein VMI54_03975 [Polyangiaceae bacterium]|nr:hypothetical protein [Polyangiaceae bacterium]
MPSHTDKRTTDTASRGFLGTLRDVLFEPTTEGRARGAPTPAANVGGETRPAALEALRQSLEAERGPAIREFTLQLEALGEALPDLGVRRRAALRVLALKGTTRSALLLEIDRLFAALDTQRRSFTGKVDARNAALEARRAEAASACQRASASAERAVAELESALGTERAKLAEATQRRNEVVAECDAAAAELGAKARGFEEAHAALRAEYVNLKRELSEPETS